MARDLCAQVWLRQAVQCAGGGCKRVLRDMADGIFVVKGSRVVGYCSQECICGAFELAVEQLRANVEIRTDLISGMGYTKCKSS